MGSYSSSMVDRIALDVALWCYSVARSALSTLLGAFGQSTEPDFASIVHVYDRMLAISLLLVGAVIACGLIDRILGGQQGLGWNAVPRTVAAVAFACLGLGIVQYVAGYAALLATSWTPDLLGVQGQLQTLHAHVSMGGDGKFPMGSIGGLILTALLTSLLALLVYLELVIRGALILLVTSFIPLVCALAIWPRMAGAASALGEFLVGLLLSKFVVATAIYIGYGLVLPAVIADEHSDWMLTGLAILFIAAFSPAVLVAGLSFTHARAGDLARGWAGNGAAWVQSSGLDRIPQRLTGLASQSSRRRPTRLASRTDPKTS